MATHYGYLAGLAAQRRARNAAQFEIPPAQERIPGEIGGKRFEVPYGDPLFKEYFDRLAVREGEYIDRPSDPGGPTNRGISQEFLDLLHKNKGEEWGYLPTRTADLTPREIESIFYKEFYVAPKIYKVAMIPGLLTAAPNLVEQLFDTGVLHGAGTAARIAQLALNEHLTKSVKVDGDVGKETRKAIAAAIREGKIDDVNNMMVEYRLEGTSKNW